MSADTRTLRIRAADERGAVIIQVGVAILVLTAFAMFIVDYGLLWVSRQQAQNSADAGALAGATSLALDDFNDRTATGPAKLAARSFAVANTVWDAAPDMQTRTVDMHVQRLRSKLGAAGDLIETVRGFGYRLRVPRHSNA